MDPTLLLYWCTILELVCSMKMCCFICFSFHRFYPYHYAPFVSDLKSFASINVKFDLGVPFKPFQQLLAVLPPASKKLLPPAYQVHIYCGFDFKKKFILSYIAADGG